MSTFAALVEAFNAGRLHELVSNTTEDYQYSDPILGRVDGADAHEALMRDVMKRFPDRRIELLNSWTADGAEFAEYRWTGTPAGGAGERIEMVFAALLEFRNGRLRRFANFRA